MDIHIQRDGQQMGPYTLEQINEYLSQDSLLATDYAWHEGLPQWVPLNEIAGVASNQAVASVPPSSNPPVATPLGKGHNKKKLLLFGGIGVGVAALIAVVLVMVLSGKKEGSQPTTPEAAAKKPEPAKAITKKNEVEAWVSDPGDLQNVIVERAIRKQLGKPTGDLTKADLGKVTVLSLRGTEITDVGLKEVAKLQKLKVLGLNGTKVTYAGVAQLKKALPNCGIGHNAKK